MRRLLAVAVTAALVGCALVVAPAAEATYPGRNGIITFNTYEILSEFEALNRTEAIRPNGTGRHVLANFALTSWSASGRRLLGIDYARDYRTGEEPRLVFADASGRPRGEVPLPDTVRCDWGGCSPLDPNVRFGAGAGVMALSPEGRTIAFVYEFNVPNTQPGALTPWIWTVRTDGSRLRRLRAGSWPHWTPDGRRIVFQRWDELGSIEEVASMRPDGTRVRPLLTDPRVLDAELRDVAPDGRRLLWRGRVKRASGSSASGLLTSDLRGRHAHVVDGSGSYPYEGAWSPDGSKIVFSREGPGRATWIAPATGGQKRRLLARPQHGLAWRPLPLAQKR